MFAILITSLLLVLGLIYTFSTTLPIKKFLAYFQSFHNHHDQQQDVHTNKNPPNNDILIKSNSNSNMVKNTTRSDHHQLKGVFGTFDKNNDGYITKQELKESLKNIGIDAGEKDVADMVAKVDSNGDGLIDFEEFCELFQFITSSSLLKNDEQEKEEEEGSGDGDLREAFDVFDGNKDGVITVEELGLVLSSLGFNEGKMLESCKEMIRQVDIDGDGMVNFVEFKRMMKSGLIPPVS